MKPIAASTICVVLLLGAASLASAQQKARTISVTLTVPSTAYKVKINEVYQTQKELWVLSTVSGGGIGLTVISKTTDKVRVEAPKLAVKHFILGKKWGWTEEKEYTYVKDRKQFQQMVQKAKAVRIYPQKGAPKKAAKEQGPTKRYIVMYHKNIFTGGKTKDGLTLEQLARKHAQQFNGKVDRILRIIDGYSIDLKPDQARLLGQLPEVRHIEEDRPVGINPPRNDR